MRRRRSLYRRVYLHGVLLLVVLGVVLSIVGAILGRDSRFRLSPARTAEYVSHLLESVPAEQVPAFLGHAADMLNVDLAVYTADGQRLAAAGRRPPRPLSAENATRLVSGGSTRRDGHLGASARLAPDRYLRLRSRVGEHDMALRALGSLAVVVLVVALVSMPLARAIAHPLEHL